MEENSDLYRQYKPPEELMACQVSVNLGFHVRR